MTISASSGNSTCPKPTPPVPALETSIEAARIPTQRRNCGFHTARVAAKRAYEEAGIGPEDVHVAEVYDLSTALELDWYEDLQFCARGDAAGLLRAGVTRLGGRLPVNASGGLACFGEAVPAQALAQVCELAWQLRGTAGARQVEGAEAAVEVVFQRELTRSHDPDAKRRELAQEYRDTFYTPYVAAECRLVDDIIEPAQTRAYVCDAVDALSAKRDWRPQKKHGLIPL